MVRELPRVCSAFRCNRRRKPVHPSATVGREIQDYVRERCRGIAKVVPTLRSARSSPTGRFEKASGRVKSKWNRYLNLLLKFGYIILAESTRDDVSRPRVVGASSAEEDGGICECILEENTTSARI